MTFDEMPDESVASPQSASPPKMSFDAMPDESHQADDVGGSVLEVIP